MVLAERKNNMNTAEIKNQIATRLQASSVELQKKIDTALHLSRMFDEAANRLQRNLDTIAHGLAAVGLEISSVGYYKTGMDSGVWADGDKLRVEIRAEAIGNKFRFLADRGYDAQGQGRNQAALQAKAAKLEAHMLEATGLTFEVNPFSLERKEQRSSSVMFSTFIS